MKTIHAMRTKRRRPLLLAATLVLGILLAACSHHDDDDRPPVTGTPTPPVATTDAFVTYVTQQVATDSDSAEPSSTDGVSVTAPEDTEPLPLPGA